MAEVRLANWLQDQQLLREIRTRVFIQEQNVSLADEWDGLDEQATHFLVWDGGEAVGCARLLVEPNQAQLRFHIGRVAILKNKRSLGLGKLLMHALLDHCRHRADWPIYLGAQSDKTGFYAGLGFVVEGEEFMDAGIPHRHMWLRLASSSRVKSS